MNAIRKIMKREGNSLNVILPESFTASQVELIILPFEEKEAAPDEETLIAFRKKAQKLFSGFNVDMTGFKFDRNELHER